MTSAENNGRTSTDVKTRFLAIISGLFLLPPAFLWGLWVIVWDRFEDAPRAERSMHFLEYFPDVVRSPWLIAGTGLLCCAASVFCSVALLRSPGLAARIIGVAWIFISSVLMFLTCVPLL